MCIAIYGPFDERDPDHWAIFLHNSDLEDVILQVSDDKGGMGYYVEEPIRSKQPQRSAQHEESIEVGAIASEDHETAVAAIQATPVDNKSSTWNCQSWAIEALDNLEEIELFEWDKEGKKKAQEKRQKWR